MPRTDRRTFLRASTAAILGTAADQYVSRALAADPVRPSPRQRPNILYALSTGSWGRVKPDGQRVSLLEILDETAATGFNGVRLTGFPGILDQNRMSLAQYGEEMAKRGLKFSTVSFGGQYYNHEKHAEIREQARTALAAHRQFGATAMVFFPPSPVPPADEAEALKQSFRFLNELGKMAIDDYGIRMGLHSHTDSLIDNQSQVDRFLEGTDPRFVFCAWDTAHLLLGGCDVQATFKKSLDRVIYTDFKDATLKPTSEDYVAPGGQRYQGDSHEGRFFNSMFELGRGQIDFTALLKMLAERKYRGWINHDLDTIRVSTAESWRVAMNYIQTTLDPIYQ